MASWPALSGCSDAEVPAPIGLKVLIVPDTFVQSSGDRGDGLLVQGIEDTIVQLRIWLPSA
jgi:hypothetical protein